MDERRVFKMAAVFQHRQNATESSRSTTSQLYMKVKPYTKPYPNPTTDPKLQQNLSLNFELFCLSSIPSPIVIHSGYELCNVTVNCDIA